MKGFSALIVAMALLTICVPAVYGGSFIFSTLNYPDVKSTLAYGTNDAGLVVGAYWSGGSSYGFLYDGAAYVTLGYPGAKSTWDILPPLTHSLLEL
jgi:hypothetical protein